MILEDGRGTGKKARVDDNNRLTVTSLSESIQHYISHENEDAYQLLTTVPVTSGNTTVAAHIKNTSADKEIVLTYIRHQFLATAGTFPSMDVNSTGNYFRISLGRTYVSDGDEIVVALNGVVGGESSIVNVNNGSGNTPEIEGHTGNPTLTGSDREIDRWYTSDGSNAQMNVFNKEGSVIIQPGNTLEIGYVSGDAVGKLYTRLSFLMKSRTK